MSAWLTEQEILAAHYQFGKLNRKMVRTAMGPNWPPGWEQAGMFDDEHDGELRTMGTLADVIKEKHDEKAAVYYLETNSSVSHSAAEGVSRPDSECGAEPRRAPLISVINQHVGWLTLYMQFMTAENWRDMNHHAARQIDKIANDIDQLAEALGIAQDALEMVSDANRTDPQIPEIALASIRRALKVCEEAK